MEKHNPVFSHGNSVARSLPSHLFPDIDNPGPGFFDRAGLNTLRRNLILIGFSLLISMQLYSQVNGDYQTRASGNWNDSNTWQVYTAGSWVNCSSPDYPGRVGIPATGTVYITGNSIVSVTDNVPASIGALTFTSTGNSNLVQFSGAFNLVINGAITINPPAVNTNNNGIYINSGIVSCASVSSLNSADDTRDCKITISDGSLAVTGNIAMFNNTARSSIEFSGPGTVSVGGSLVTGTLIGSTGTINIAGAFTPAAFTVNSSTVNFNGNNQAVSNFPYFNLSCSTGGAKTLPAANLGISGNLNINNSTLAFDAAAARTLTVNGNLSGNGTIDMSPGSRTHTLTLAGTANSIGTLTTAAGIASTVNYSRAGDQSVFGSPNYRNVTFSTGGVKTLSSDAAIGGNLSINGGATLNLGSIATSISVAGTSTINSAGGGLHFGTLTSKNMTLAGILSFTAGTLEMSGSAGNVLDLKGNANTGGGTFGACANNPEVRYSTAGPQNVIGLNYCSLTLSGTGTKTLMGITGVGNNLAISGNATLYTNSFQITGNATGAFTMAPNTSLILGNNAVAIAVLFPTGFTTPNITLDPSSTVTYQANADQVMSSVPAYGILIISTARIRTCDGNLSVVGTLTVNASATLSAGTLPATWNVTGPVVITGTLDFGTAAAKTISIGGNLSGAGTIAMTGAGLAHALNLGGSLNAIGTFNTTPNSGSLVNYNGLFGQQVFNSISYQNLTISGSGTKSLNTGNSIVNGNLTINGSSLDFAPGAARSLTVVGDLSGSGTLDMSSAGHTVNLGGINNSIGTLVSGPATTINYNRAGNQKVFGSPNYRNLTISGGGTKTMQDIVTVAGTLNLTLGVLQIEDHNLTLSNITPIAGAPFDVTKMIETNGPGRLVRIANATNASFNQTYPVGSGGYYNPFVLSGLAGAVAAPRSISVGAVPVNPGALSNTINKYWDLSTSGITTGAAMALSFKYNAGESIGDPLLFQPYTNATGTWTLATGPSAPGTNPAISTGSATIDGFWTVGSPSTFYSYQTGPFDQASTWTFDPGGTTGPGTAIPGDNDKVVILSGRTVTLQADNFTQKLDISINNGGILDLSTYSFWNDLAALRGQGTLKLSSSNFPIATVNTFVTTDGGITEYNHTGTMSLSQLTYYHLVIRSAGSVTMVNHVVLNGNLDIKQGTFQINDAAARKLQLIIKGNVTVDNPGAISVGTGRTNSQPAPLPSITGSITPPFLNYYELQSHRVQIYGDFTNNGVVRFSNLNNPVYDRFPVDGFATVYFNGLSDNTVICNGRSDFYNLIVDKGTDQTFKLTVQSSAYNNFRIYGANTSDASNTLPAAASSNPNIKKALWIKNGTLVLQGLVAIPSLSEGFTAGGFPSDFFIPANGALVLDGAGIIVLATADDYTEVNAAYGLAGGSNAAYGINTSGGYSGFSNLGKLQVNNGYLSTRESSGLNYWSYASGQFILNGGKIDTKQFHNPEGAVTGLVSWVQNGGTLNLRGRFTNTISYTTPASLSGAVLNTTRATNGIDVTAGMGTFNINSNAANGFSMSAGNLNIYDVCNTATPVAILINCPFSNINVSGGNVSLFPTTGTVDPDADFIVNSLAPFYNFTINRASGTSSVILNTNPLTVTNNLALTSGSFNASNLNVTVGGNFNIESGTTYTTGTNTTIFNGSANQSFTINIAAPQTLNRLTIDKPAGVALNLAGSQSDLIASGDFRLVAGTLNDNGKTVSLAGNIFNSGICTGTGKIVMNGTAVQTIDGNGIFGNLDFFNTNAAVAPVSLLSNITLNGTVSFRNDKLFNIGTSGVKLTATASIQNAGASRYFKSSGNTGDGGLSKTFNSPAAFEFPVGVNNYTPSSTSFSGPLTAYGTISVVPVNYEHPNVTTTGRSLTYFWRVKSAGFVLGAEKVTHSYKYADGNIVSGGTVSEDQYIAARFDILTNSWTQGNSSDVDEALNLIGEPGAGAFLENTGVIDGDYTAGDDNPSNPFGTPSIFYSRGSGLWSSTNTWSFIDHAGPVAGSVPGASDIVIIGDRDSVYLATNLTVANTDVRSCASLRIEKGSALDIGYNPGCNFAMVVTHPSGNGNFRLTTSSADRSFYVFPSGDFSDFNVNKGTTEFYTTNPTINTIFILPTATSSYGTVILSPLAESNIALPNRADLTIFGDLICRGQDWRSWLAMSWFWNQGYGVVIPKTVNVKGNLLVQGGSFTFVSNSTTLQHIIIDGNVIVNPGAGIDLWADTRNSLISIGGSLINNSNNDLTYTVPPWGGSNVRLYVNATQKCDVEFFGPNNAFITNTGTTPATGSAPNTTFGNVIINKGTSQATTLTLNIKGNLSTPVDAWLTFQNGTLRYERTDPGSDFTISQATAQTIPATSGLYVDLPGNSGNRNILIGNASNNSGDLLLNGKLTLVRGNIYVGPVATTAFNNDIEYSVGNASSIDIQGGNLVVNGQIRRNTAAAGGILKYNQAGGTVVVRGQAANGTNAKFEVLNGGSTFTMSNGTFTILRGNGALTTPSSAFGDLYIRPETGSVTGGTIVFSQGGLAAPQNYFIDATIPLNHVIITGTSPANFAAVRILTSPLTVNGNMTINANSILNSNNINVTFNGNLVNTPGVTGYIAGTNQTTFSATNASSFAGVQSVTGATDFYDLNVSPGTSLTINNPVTVNKNLSINTGNMIMGANPVTLLGDVMNNASYSDNNGPGTGLHLKGSTLQLISGSGSFARLTLNNAAGARVENNITVQEDLTMTLGILDIKKNLLTMGTLSNLQGAPFSAVKMITSDGVFSNVGLRKFFNPGATTFFYPIGTSGKYTPALLTITANSTVGFVRVNNINSRHPAVLDPSNALDYYWEIQSSGISNFSGNIVLNYLDGDVVGDENAYQAARLVIPGSTWSLSPGVAPAANTTTTNYAGTNNISGEYTAGTIASFFTNVPVYTSNAPGNWTDESIWTQTGGDPYPCPPDGPNGFIVNINHEITLDANYCFAYRTTINNKLKVITPFYGHNLGTVTGTGTLYLESGSFPAGVYTAFMDCSNNATIEFGGSGTYTIIADLYDHISNLIVSGTGTRVLPNLDLTICNTLTIDGPVLDNSIYNKKLTIQGSMKRLSGAFTSGNLAGAIVSFAGSGAQTIGGPVMGDFTGTSAFNHLEINNASGLRINDNGAVEVKGNLMLTNGLINTGINRSLTITNSVESCVIPAGGKATSFVDGPLTKRISQYGTFLFPVGINKSGSFVLGNKLKISSTQTGPLLWTVQYHNPNTTSTSFTAPLMGVSAMEYFTISTTAGSQAQVNIDWNPSSDVNPVITGGIPNIRVANYNTGTSKWIEVPTSSAGDNSNGTASSSALMTFSGMDDYTLGSTTTLIPRAQFTPTGPVCGNDGIPVSFTSPNPIPFSYTLNYSINGIAQAAVTVAAVPYILPTPVPGSYKLTSFKYNGGTLDGVIDATAVPVFAYPTTSDAGANQTRCGITTTDLAGNTPLIGSGLWSIVTGTGGTLITPASPTSQFIGLNGNTYTLRWTISNGTCISSDDVVINFTILPEAPAAAPNQNFCGPHTIADLIATAPVGSTIDWYSAAAAGVLLPPATALVTGTTYYAESNAGCVSLSRTPVLVTVNPVPLPGLVGPNSVCIGSTGNNYSTEAGKSNYVWTVVGGTITAGGLGTDNSAVVTWNTSGPQSVSVNYQDAGGCTAASPTLLPVTVNPEPTITFGANPVICSGTTSANLTYSSTTGSPDRYTVDYDAAAEAKGFMDATNIVLPAGAISLVVPGTAPAGSYNGTITVKNNVAGCISGTYAISITVNALPTPTITGPLTPCVNSTGNIYTTEAGMTGYVWTIPAGGTKTAGGTATDNTVTVTWNTTGAQTVSVNYTNAGLCTAAAPTVATVTVGALPTPTITGPTPVCLNSTGNIYTTEAGMTGYNWLVSGGTITAGGLATDNTATVTWTTVGIQTISVGYTDGSACTSSAPTVYNVTVDGIPTITTGPDPSVCEGITSADLTYTATSGTPDRYGIDYNAAAELAGFVDIPVTTVLPASPISLVVPGAAPAGTYSGNLIVINSSVGCTSGTYPVSVTINSLPVPIITGSANACLNVPGNVYTTEAGMTGYNWTIIGGTITSGGSVTDNTATVTWTTAGSQSVSVNYTNGSNCTAAAASTFNVAVSPLPVPTIAGPASACINSTGNVYTTEAGMTGYTWVVTGGSITAGGLSTDNTATVTWTTAGSQMITVNYTDGSSCSSAAPAIFNVTVNALPVPTLAGSSVVCLNSAGNIYTTEPGMTGYIWTVTGGTVTSGGGASDNTVTVTWDNSGPGSVGVNYTDAGICTATVPTILNINVTSLPSVAWVQTDVACFSGATGALDITVTGGTALYNYSWNGTGVIATMEDQTGLVAGAYTVTVTDANNCSSGVVGFNINEPGSALTGAIVTKSDVTVYNGNDGSVEVAGSGGAAPYMYSIDGGAFQASGIFGTLTAGLHTITVRDNNLCTTDVPVTLIQPPASLSGSIVDQDNVTCFGTLTGSVTVAGSGGSAPYEYQLDGGPWQGSGIFGSLAGGNYVVIVRDAVLDSVSVPVTIFAPVAPLSGNISSQTEVLCFGGSTGSVTIAPAGGIAPYQYKIDGGSLQPSAIFTSLNAGTHIVVIEDSKGCTIPVNVVITEPAAALTGSLTLVNVTCNGAANGSVSVAASGGTLSYQYSLNGGAFQATPSFTGIAPGNHSVTLRDNNMCAVNLPFTITEPAILTVTAVSTDATCPDTPDGSINLTISGGTGPYNVIWLNGPLTTSRVNILHGDYSAVVTDFNGCAVDIDVTVGVTGTIACVEVPEIMTPNSDGFNDTWRIRNIDLFPNAEVHIYNRWGKLIFNTKNLSANEWDGTLRGKPLPTDSYHYILDLKDGSKPRSGVISIIRTK